jgi:hypothetical protein
MSTWRTWRPRQRQSGGRRKPDNQVRIFILWLGAAAEIEQQSSRAQARERSFIAETFRDQWAELVTASRASGPLATSTLVALRSLQRHQGRDAAGVGRAVAKLKSDLTLERFGNAR